MYNIQYNIMYTCKSENLHFFYHINYFEPYSFKKLEIIYFDIGIPYFTVTILR